MHKFLNKRLAGMYLFLEMRAFLKLTWLLAEFSSHGCGTVVHTFWSVVSRGLLSALSCLPCGPCTTYSLLLQAWQGKDSSFKRFYLIKSGPHQIMSLNSKSSHLGLELHLHNPFTFPYYVIVGGISHHIYSSLLFPHTQGKGLYRMYK